MGDVRVPTLIGQGQADTLFNLQESVATYTALKRQGTPGLAGLAVVGPQRPDPQPGELDMRHPAQSLAGPRGAGLVRPLRPRPRHRAAAGLRLLPRLGVRGHARHHQAYATAPSYPVGKERTFYLSGTSTPGADGALVTSRSQVRPGTSTLQQPGAGRPELHRDVGARPEPAGHRSAGVGDPVRHAAADQADGRRRLAPADRAAVRPVGGRHPGGRARPVSWWPSPSSTTSARTARSSCRTG